MNNTVDKEKNIKLIVTQEEYNLFVKMLKEAREDNVKLRKLFDIPYPWDEIPPKT